MWKDAINKAIYSKTFIDYYKDNSLEEYKDLIMMNILAKSIMVEEDFQMDIEEVRQYLNEKVRELELLLEEEDINEYIRKQNNIKRGVIDE